MESMKDYTRKGYSDIKCPKCKLYLSDYRIAYKCEICGYVIKKSPLDKEAYVSGDG